MKKLLVLLISSVLLGCATQAQQKSQQLELQYVSALRSMDSCAQPILETLLVRRLSERFLFDTDDMKKLEKLSSADHVTQQEAQDLINFSALMNRCDKRAIEDFSKIHPEYAAYLAKMFAEADADLVKAINKKFTIGEINQRTVDRNIRWNEEFSEIGRRIESHFNKAHEYELLQRQTATRALQIWSSQQQILYNQQRLLDANTRPRMTNCRYVGDALNCVSF
jgi:hypothetical protein